MSFKNITNAVTNKVGRQILVTRKHSPVLLLGVGVTGFVATVALACRATLKLNDVLEEGQKEQADLQERIEIDGESNVLEKKKFNAQLKVAIKVAQLYAPAALTGVVSIGAFTGSHVILSRRNVALTAAYATVDKAFKEYRERVAKELGVEKEKELRYDMVDREIAVETDEGPVVKTVKGVDRNNGPSMYAKYFDEMNPNWTKTPHSNQFFIRNIQNYANDKLQARGHLFLNEVYEMLGMEHTEAGAVVGWVRGNGDSFVDFGVFNDVFDGHSFVVGETRDILLDFNVDGVIYDLIGK